MRTSTKRITLMAGIAATSVVLGLTGCSAPAPAVDPSPAPASSTPSAVVTSAAPAASAPLRCADLIDPQEVVAAFTRSGTTTTGSVVAITPYDALLTGPVAVTGAGGLSCAWSVRTSGSTTSAGTLLVQVLPGAAAQFGALMYGDGPTSDRREFAGISAAATCGDPGCGASGVVGSSWVRVDMTIPGSGGEGSVFGGESQDAILSGASPAIGRVFTAVQHASAAQLAFPEHAGSPGRDPRCEGILRSTDLAPLLGSKGATYELEPLTGATASISGAAAHDLGSYRCFARGTSTTGGSTAQITVAPGQAWAVRALEGSRYYDSAPLLRTRLVGATGSESAETTCVSGGTNECTTVFSLGDLAVQVDGTPNATRIAEAIIADAR